MFERNDNGLVSAYTDSSEKSIQKADEKPGEGHGIVLRMIAG